MDKTKYTAAHIANYFFCKAREDKIKDLSVMKLIKLTYFSYAWYMAIYQRYLFVENIEAWTHGPVIPSLYHEFKHFRKKTINTFASEYDIDNDSVVYPSIDYEDEDTISVLDAVWNAYKNYSGWNLSKITHRAGSPWQKARSKGKNNQVLDNSDIIKMARNAITEKVLNKKK